MKNNWIVISSISLITFLVHIGCKEVGNTEIESGFSKEKARSVLDHSMIQYRGMMTTLPDSLLPRTFENGQLVTCDYNWWTSGFYPGTLWYLYEYSGMKDFEAAAKRKTELLEPVKNITSSHDLGFMLHCSFGNGYRLTKNPHYKDVLLTGAASLSQRFNSDVGAIKSWDWLGPSEYISGYEKERAAWQYPVIIDNMMNLELLMWVHEAMLIDNPYRDIAITHANTTIDHHFRDDFSSVHVVDFDSISGNVRHRHTHQGYADDSSWARGQVWGLYGFTMMYRMSHDSRYLDQAKNIANYLFSHPNFPEDGIPFWDFNDLNIPNALRDASAGAILASALLELFHHSPQDNYFNIAETILNTLSSDKYLAAINTNGNFILNHSVGHLPGDSEVDVPLSYADYYFVEALMRYLNTK